MGEARIGQEDNGGEAVLDALSRRFHAPLIRYFLRRGFAAADAEDLTQNVFARLSTKSDLASLGSVEGYIFAIAANAAIDHARRRKVRVDGIMALQNCGEADQEVPPDRVLEGREELAAVVSALNEMPERMRTIFILARLENMTRVEVAKRLGISKSLVDLDMSLAVACIADRRRRLS